MIFLADEKGRQDVELGMLQLQGVIKWQGVAQEYFYFTNIRNLQHSC